MKKCPRCGGKRFKIIAKVIQEWIVDENEELKEVVDDLEVVFKSNDNSMWKCDNCDYMDFGRRFNVDTRLEKLQQHIANEQKQKEEKEKAEKKYNDTLCKKICTLRPRIEKLIELGNAVRVAGKLVHITWLGNYNAPNVFRAEGIYHRLGFMDQGYEDDNQIIKFIGFDCGGACGKYDFYTNGDEIFDKHEETKAIIHPSSEHMEKFLKEFDEFEKRFYDWFDKEFA